MRLERAMPPNTHLPFEVCGLSLYDEAAWRKHRQYVCRLCGHRAHYHPTDPYIWACLSCRLATDKPNALFQEVEVANDNVIDP